MWHQHSCHLASANPRDPISGVWFQLQQENNRAVPITPATKPTTCRHLFCHAATARPCPSGTGVPCSHRSLSPRLFPLIPFPPTTAQPRPSAQEHHPATVAFSHQQRTRQPSTESAAPNWSHTHQFALLICSNGTNPLKDVKSPQALLLTHLLHIPPPRRSWENASLRQKEKSPSG